MALPTLMTTQVQSGFSFKTETYKRISRVVRVKLGVVAMNQTMNARILRRGNTLNHAARASLY